MGRAGRLLWCFCDGLELFLRSACCRDFYSPEIFLGCTSAAAARHKKQVSAAFSFIARAPLWVWCTLAPLVLIYFVLALGSVRQQGSRAHTGIAVKYSDNTDFICCEVPEKFAMDGYS